MNTTEVANPGLLRPPLLYLASGILALVANGHWPWQFSLGLPGVVIGIGMAMSSVTLLVLTLKEFRVNQTPFPGNRPVKAMVDSGPFRFSRNPAYLAFSGILLGLLFVVQTYWLVLALIASVLVLDRFVIPREERYLRQHFGDRFTEYQNRVRRWF